jgi:hypothetical protein
MDGALFALFSVRLSTSFGQARVLSQAPYFPTLVLFEKREAGDFLTSFAL